MGISKSPVNWSASKQPIYLQLATIFRLRIENGLWPCGEQVPTVETLMQEFGVGRITVRNAFAELEQEGLLVRSRGRGTFVLALPDAALPRFDVGGTWAELVARGNLNEPLQIQYLGKTPGPLPDWCQADGQLAPKYQGLARVYTRRNIRVCYSRVYLEASLYRKLKGFLEKQSVVAVLGNHVGDKLASGRQTITMTSADEETASQLCIPVSSPIAQIHRQIYDKQGLLVYWSCVHYDARYLKLEFDLFR